MFFDTSILEILKEGIGGSLSNVLNMAAFIIPLMVILEVARHYKWVDRLSVYTAPALKRIGLGYHAALPLVIGVAFGILYGSGIMIDNLERGEIDQREVSLILIFLVVCHAIFEDSIIFWSVGSNFFILFFGRILGAIAITWVFSKTIKEGENIPHDRSRDEL